MPPLCIKPHLTYEAIGQRYKTCKNATEKSYWHLIWLMANPHHPMLVTEAAKTVKIPVNPSNPAKIALRTPQVVSHPYRKTAGM